MKFNGAIVLVSLVCLAIGYPQDEVTKEEMHVALRGLAQKCKEDTGASDADVETIIQHEIASTHEGKCLRFCLMTTFNLITAERKGVKENMMKIADLMAKGDAEKLKMADEIIEGCKDLTDADPCEAAHLITKCLKDATDARGIIVEW